MSGKTKTQLITELTILKEDRANLEREAKDGWACARKYEGLNDLAQLRIESLKGRLIAAGIDPNFPLPAPTERNQP